MDIKLIYLVCLVAFMGSCVDDTKTEYRVWECRNHEILIDTILTQGKRKIFHGSKIGETHFRLDTLIRNTFVHFKNSRTLETNDLFLVCSSCPYQLEDNKEWYNFMIDSIKNGDNGANFDFEIFFNINLGSLSVFRLGQYACKLDFIILESDNKKDTLFMKNDIPLYPPPPPPLTSEEK